MAATRLDEDEGRFAATLAQLCMLRNRSDVQGTAPQMSDGEWVEYPSFAVTAKPASVPVCRSPQPPGVVSDDELRVDDEASQGDDDRWEREIDELRPCVSGSEDFDDVDGSSVLAPFLPEDAGYEYEHAAVELRNQVGDVLRRARRLRKQVTAAIERTRRKQKNAERVKRQQRRRGDA